MNLIRFCEIGPVDDAHKIALDAAYQRVMNSGVFIGGEEVNTFEAEFADYVGAKHCVGVSSGFSALSLIMRAFGVTSVSIPANTCRPTFAAAVDAGIHAEQIKVIEPIDFPVLRQVDTQDVNTDALIRVFLHGYHSNCQPYNTRVYIDDACQAHSKHYKERHCASQSHAAAWSFYPTKNLGAYGDAGAVTTNIDEIACRIRALRDYRGRDGVNARLDPLQAAFLRVNLQRLDKWNEQRAEQAAYYSRRLRHYETIRDDLILPPASLSTSWHHYVVQVRTKHRDKLRLFLHKKQIETAVHYCEPGSSYINQFPIRTLDECASKLSLPLGPHLTPDDLSRVIDAIFEYYERESK